jgi:hypothetical protein
MIVDQIPTRRRQAVLMTARDVLVAEPHALRAPLGLLERTVVEAIGTERSVADVSQALSLSIVELTTICTRLMELDLISVTPFGVEDDLALLDDAWEVAAETTRTEVKR